MSVGVGVGLVMLAREGLSFAALKRWRSEEETPPRTCWRSSTTSAELDDSADEAEPLVTEGRSRR